MALSLDTRGQVLSKVRHRSVEMGLYRPGIYSQCPGHVPLGHVRDVAQHDNLLLTTGQAPQRPDQVFPLGPIIRRVTHLLHGRESSLTTNLVECGVRRHPDHPRLGVLHPADGLPACVGTGQGLQRHVFRHAASCDAGRHSAGAWKDTREEILERREFRLCRSLFFHRAHHQPLQRVTPLFG